MIYTIVYLAVGGNAYWHKVRNRGGQVVQLRPYHAGQIIPIPGGDDWIIAYAYDVTGGGNMTEGLPRILPEDIVHFKWPVIDPTQPWVAQPPLMAAAREIDTDNEATRYLYALLKNDAVPRTVMYTGETAFLEPDQITRMKEQFRERYSGDRRGDVAIIEGATKIERLSLNLEELAFEALHKMPEARIAAVMRVPPILAGLNVGLDRSTFANYGEARKALAQDTLVPLWGIVSSEVQADLVPEFGNSVAVRHDLTRVQALQEDVNTKWLRVNTVYTSGILERNEARRALGYADAPDVVVTAPPADALVSDEMQKALDAQRHLLFTAFAVAAKELRFEAGTHVELHKEIPAPLPPVQLIETKQDGFTGAMLALFLPIDVAQSLFALAAGIPGLRDLVATNDMHLTLVYLGKADDLETYYLRIRQALRDVCEGQLLIEGIISGIGRFNNDEGDGTNALYVSYDAPVLNQIRQDLVGALTAARVPFPDGHGFTPHITLGYIPAGVPLPTVEVPPMPCTFDLVTFAWGDDRFSVPLISPPKALQFKARSDPRKAARQLQRIRKDLTRRMAGAVDAFFTDLSDRVLSRTEKAWAPSTETKDLPGIEELIKDDDYLDLETLFKRYYIEILSASWETWNQSLGIDVAFEPSDPAVVKTLKTAGGQIAGISNSTRDEVRALLKYGAEQGWTLGQLAAGDETMPGLRALVQQTYKGRAETIARTELATAQQVCAIERFAEMKIEKVLVLDNGQDDPDEECARVNNTIQTLEWARENPIAHPRCTRAFAPQYD